MNLEAAQLVIRDTKGEKKRRQKRIPLCSILEDLREQVESARMNSSDATSGLRLPVTLPHQLASESIQRRRFDWNWAWLFPATKYCIDPRTGQRVRWRLHEASLQRAVRTAAQAGVFILPHELRHAYATLTALIAAPIPAPFRRSDGPEILGDHHRIFPCQKR